MTWSDTADGDDDDGGGSRTPLVVAVVLAVLALGGLGWAAVALVDGDQTPTAAPTRIPPTATPPAAPPTPGAPSPDDAPSGPAEGENPLEDLLGSGGLDDLFGDGGLEDLLGGEGLEDLLGGGALDPGVLACLAPDGVQPSLQGTPLPDDPAEAIATISDQVAELRGLSFTTPVDLELLERDEIADRVVTLTEEDYPVRESDVDEAILVALGQADPDIDLRATFLDLLGEQVAGFYDPETGELVAESSGQLAPADRVIVAHELDHALTDQALGLPDLDAEEDVDALLAQQALVEGDATVLMQQWAAAHLSLMDQLALAVPGVETDALESAPWVLQQQLLYPYQEGLGFVCSQYDEGGWAAVDAMYDDLPTTTAQVLFPERYAAREEAVRVDAPTLDGATELRSTTWGAADLKWLLEAPGNDPDAGPEDALAQAEDWAGGRLAAWDLDGEAVVAVRVAQVSGGTVCASMANWHGAAFPDADAATTVGAETAAWVGGDRAGTLTCRDDVITVVVGPDLDSVRRVG